MGVLKIDCRAAGVVAAAVFFVLVQSCSTPKSKTAKTAPVTQAPDIYAEHIRTSVFQTPEQEKDSFLLPPGFEITLFASEPDITKPINMEFDDRGRLWVTQSSEYPVAAGEGDGKDRITILEDKNGDGKAETFTHFDDNLNIPIGIMPVADGAIAYSIPNLYYFKDDNNDGKADSKKILLGEFGHKDTHGMVNNLMRGFDGWLHVCHGFSNTSHVAGTDGDTTRMTSGNTFRVKMDGSHVEQTTFGRVNPFGYAYDERGFLYSVDCHTKPITQLIFGADYAHFGKKAPAGLGFAPVMMNFDLASTALAGLVYYTGTQFPEEYKHSFFTGDVVTCRIDRTSTTFTGTTPTAKKEEPFLISKDPWFRPVDVKVGPDGALYIADFYNKIIGHYEVALNHPGRDRVSGRIWKITYKGDKPHQDMAVTDWSKATLEQLIAGLKHPQLNTRLKVADRIVDTWKEQAVKPLKASFYTSIKNKDYTPAVHILWILERLNAHDPDIAFEAAKSSDPVLRVHAFRLFNEDRGMFYDVNTLVVNALKTDSDPFVRRIAAEVLGRNPRIENVELLTTLHDQTDPSDTHLRYTALLALRDNLKDPRILWRLPAMKWTDPQLALMTKVMLDVPSSTAASFMLDYTLTHEIRSEDLVKNLEYIGRHVSPYQLDKAIDLINKRFVSEPEIQLSLYKTIQAGVRQSGSAPSDKLTGWGTQLSTHFLAINSAKADTSKARVLSRIDEQRIQAADIAGDYKVKSLEPKLREIVKTDSIDYRVRTAAAGALMNMDAQGNVAVISEVMQNPKEVPALREKLAATMEQAASPSVYEMLKKQLASGAWSLQVVIASVLANSEQGIDYLLSAFREQEVNADVANEVAVQERLMSNANKGQQAEMEKLLAAGANERAERQKLIDTRLAAFKPTTGLTDQGRAVFTQNCSGCHSILGQGGAVGPNLDGIGNWGSKALTQKILDPNRNITEAFRTYNITLKNEKTLTGLYRRTEGETMVFADLTGQEFAVAKNDMKEYRASKYTLMPDQFKEILPEKDFYALLDYLLSVK